MKYSLNGIVLIILICSDIVSATEWGERNEAATWLEAKKYCESMHWKLPSLQQVEAEIETFGKESIWINDSNADSGFAAVRKGKKIKGKTNDARVELPFFCVKESVGVVKESPLDEVIEEPLLPNITPLRDVRARLKSGEGIKRPYFDMDKLPQGRVEQKQEIGNVYEVRISEKIMFDACQYVIPKHEERVYGALNVFAAEIYEVLDEKASCEYKIYIQGSADAPECKIPGTLRGGEYNFKKIEVLEKDTLGGLLDGKNDPYKNDPHIQNNRYINKHLPNLRASFFKHIFYNAYPQLGKRSLVVNGYVTDRIDLSDRNAKITLYVNPRRCN